jgi:serine/threonine protein kinase
MSPEQARSEPLDSRSDLYSVAVCLYELLTGERLFVHAGLTTSSADIYKQPIPIVSRKVSGLPPAFDKLMLKALALDPRARFQTAGEFQEALLRAAHRSGLIMSAPQLSRHLREICGAPDNWRRIDGSDAGAMPGEGTELYDVGGGTEQIAVSSLDDSGGDLIEIVDEPTRARARRPSRPASRPASRVAESARRRVRQATSITNISRLQGLELTSMINLAAGEHTGAHPLVDLSDFGGPNPIITSGTISTEPPATDLDAMDAEALPIEDDHSTDSIPEHDTPAPTERVQMPEEPARAGGPRRPAVVVSVIVLLGIGVAVAIALSGPRVNANDVERRDLPRGTAVAPAAPQPATTATPDATP